MRPIPLGILSDAPECPSGLARITRDLCQRLYTANLPIRLATFGFNGHGSKDFPWTQYSLGTFGNANDIPRGLIAPWIDFTGGERGILLTIYDIPRLEAFRFPEAYGAPWNEFLKQVSFHLAGYFPIDSNTPGGGLDSSSQEVLKAFDSILAYGSYGAGVLEKAAPKKAPIKWLPHGIDPNVFRPLGKGARKLIRREVPSELASNGKRLVDLGEKKLLGVVATNQARKDWGAVFKVLEALGPEWALWGHTDQLVRYWNLSELPEIYGVSDRTFFTQALPDEKLAELYSACDVTFAPGLGEGFGFPILESLSCGVPVAHLDYAGGADLIPARMRIPPLSFRMEGPYCLERPISNVESTVKMIESLAGTESGDSALPFTWPALWPQWKRWFQDLLEDFKEGGKK